MLREIYEKVGRTDKFAACVEFLEANLFTQWDDTCDGVWEANELNCFCRGWSEITWDNGATKVVLIGNGYVLKKSIDLIAIDDDNMIESKVDFCALEYQIYQLAREAGVEQFFAEQIRVGENVYMQEEYDETFSEWQKNSVLDNILLQYIEDGNGMRWAEMHAKAYGLELLLDKLESSRAFAFFVSMYDLEDLLKLQRFLEEFDINDLHGGNIAWYGDRLRFIDYGGYHSDTSLLVSNAMACRLKG